MKSILLHVHEDDGQAARFQAAIDLARAHEAHLRCLQVIPVNTYSAFDPMYVNAGMAADLLEMAHDTAAQQRAQWEPRIKDAGIHWDWLVCDALSIPQAIASRSHLVDLVVVSRTSSGSTLDAPLALVGTLTMTTRTPILAVPPEPAPFNAAAPITIAWNRSREAAHALRAGLAFLHLAAEVHLIEIDESRTDARSNDSTGEDACTYLSWHGIHARLHKLGRDHRDVGDMLVTQAASLGSGLIVMGAYGHSRAYEYILGGVTRHMLTQSPVPLLLAH